MTTIDRLVRAALMLAVCGALPPLPLVAGEARVIEVLASPQTDGTWRFSVTVAHDDTGWDHYADKWQVLGPEGELLGERVLLHPHVEEQPFTRSLSGVHIPAAVAVVTVRAHDTVDGWGQPIEVTLSAK